MPIRKVLVLRRPSIWSRQPALATRVDLGPLKHTSTRDVPGFNDRLMAWLPSTIEVRCRVGERGGFFQRLRWETLMAHTLAQTNLKPESLVGTLAGYVRVVEIPVFNDRSQAMDSSWSSLGRGERLVVPSALMAKTVRKAQTLIGVEPNRLNVA